MKRTPLFGILVIGTALTATASSAFAASGMAGDISVYPTPFVSTRSPAEVRAELAQFKQSGANPWSMSYNQLRSFQSAKTHAHVEQEFLASRDEVRAIGGEDSGSTWLAHQGAKEGAPKLAGTPTRAQ